MRIHNMSNLVLVFGAASSISLSGSARATWFDAATGQPVHVTPRGGQGGGNPDQATIHDEEFKNVRNLYWDKVCNTWRDSQNGKEVHVTPRGGQGGGNPDQATIHDEEFKNVRNLYWIPCPAPTTQTSWTGGYIGGELAKNSGRVRSTETRDATGVITNQFVDSGDPIGVGIVGGYNFRPWNNSVVIGPFASFDYLNQTINHNFAGGQFLGTTTHWFINAGVKAGVDVAPGFLVYGLAGAAWLNHDLNVNFAAAARSNVTTPGFTAGVGVEYAPASWRVLGMPVSVFAQYQHTWWNTAKFNTPASSPAFNYAFRRGDDTFKLGVNFYFNAPPAK